MQFGCRRCAPAKLVMLCNPPATRVADLALLIFGLRIWRVKVQARLYAKTVDQTAVLIERML
jgi:hypothetical protein